MLSSWYHWHLRTELFSCILEYLCIPNIITIHFPLNYSIWIALSILPCAHVLWVRDEKQLKIIRHNESGQWVMGNTVHDAITKMEGVPSDLMAIIGTPAGRRDSADAVFICLTTSHDGLNETLPSLNPLWEWTHYLTVGQGNANMNYMKNMKLLPLVLQKIREEQELELLVAPRPNQLCILEIRELVVVPPWTIPLRRDLLSPQPRAVEFAFVAGQQSPPVTQYLSQWVLNMIMEALAPSMHQLHNPLYVPATWPITVICACLFNLHLFKMVVESTDQYHYK